MYIFFIYITRSWNNKLVFVHGLFKIMTKWGKWFKPQILFLLIVPST